MTTASPLARSGRARWLLRSLVAASLVSSPGYAAQRTLHLTVQAQTHFEQLARSAPDTAVNQHRLRLLDDAGSPLAGADVGIRVEDSPRSVQLSPCASGSALRDSSRAGASVLITDSEGRLCVRVGGSASIGTLQFSFAGDALHLPSEVHIPLRPEHADPGLRFDSAALELSLDQPTQRVQLTLSDADAPEGLPSIAVSMQEADRELSLQTSDWVRSGSGLAFNLRSEQLGRPGPARLIARLRGAEGVVSAQAEVVALRVASVLVHADVRGVDASGADLDVSAATQAGIAASGWIDASSAEHVVGSSQLVEGTARLRVNFASPGPLTLSLRYGTDDPWWLPGAPVEVTLEPSKPKAPARWPWLVLLLPIGFVCLRALQRPALRQPRRARRPLPQVGPLRVEPQPGAAGWRGTVVDAHEGRPISDARVEARLPSLRASPAGLVAITDAAGYFELPALQQPLPEGARLNVTAPLHTGIERPLPPQGRVDVALVSRRRVLLRRLVRWARAMGPPWSRAGEPTPAQIVDVALRRGDLETARWAEEVEAAAFGQARVDQGREASLRAQEPPWQKVGEHPEERDDE
jgi:hypothetical protein